MLDIVCGRKNGFYAGLLVGEPTASVGPCFEGTCLGLVEREAKRKTVILGGPHILPRTQKETIAFQDTPTCHPKAWQASMMASSNENMLPPAQWFSQKS